MAPETTLVRTLSPTAPHPAFYFMSAIIRVAACSYEGSLFGWNVTEERARDDSKKQPAVSEHLLNKISLVFGFNVSKGSFRAIAVSRTGRYLAVAGNDERIHLFNMLDNKSIGEISGHGGGITSLAFVEDNFLISGSEDHTMYIWRVHDWQHLHILGGHKDTVVGFAVHPTGKMALSISKDQTMKLWNLVQGRCSFTRKLRSVAEHIMWHPEGNHYLLVTSTELQMFAVADNSCVFSIKSKSRVNHATFYKISINNEPVYRIVYICDNQSLNIVDMTGVTVSSLSLSSIGMGRLKAVASCLSTGLAKLDADDSDIEQSDSVTSDCVVVVSSTGCVAVMNGYLLEQKAENQDSETIFGKALYAFDQLRADPRLTSVVAWNSSVSKWAKKQASLVRSVDQDDAQVLVEDENESSSSSSDSEQEEVIQVTQAPKSLKSKNDKQEKQKAVKAAKKQVKFQASEEKLPTKGMSGKPKSALKNRK